MEKPRKQNIFKQLFSRISKNYVSEQSIKSIVDEGQKEGILEDNEAEMIHNIIELDEKNAKDIMTHRKDIVAINGDDTLDVASKYMVERQYSRFPVYKDDIDNILGIISLKDIFKIYQSENNHFKKICEINGLLRPAEIIPETRDIYTLFNWMRESKNHIAVVVDEYGRTSGVVALEDILEEIVGNIFDEYDTDDEDINKISEGKYIIRGITQLNEVKDELDIDFEDEENETINGFLITLLEHIPEENSKEEVNYKGYNFKILTIQDKMIDKILVTKL